MKKTKILNENGSSQTVLLSNDKIITISLSDDDYSVSFWEDGVEIGGYEDFSFMEDEYKPNLFLLARMFLPFRRSGLGTATVKFFKKYFDATIYVRPNDGYERTDGSNLTGDAPSFVSHLIALNLIEDNEDNG